MYYVPSTVLSSLRGPALEYAQMFYEEDTIIINPIFQMRKVRYGMS